MKNTQNTGKAQVDFTSGRGFGLMGVGLFDDFLTGDASIPLATIAFLYTHPDPTRVNSYGQAMATLALYGAGAQVFLTPEQYSDIDAKVAEYESIMRAPAPHGLPRNEALAAFVRAQAAQQHRLYGSHSGGKTRLDFESGRGFGPVGADLPDAFLRWDRACVLNTIAVMFTHPNPTRVNTPCQAVALLALYGAGALVDLTKQQYRRLEKAVREYESYMRAPAPHDQPGNESFARIARRAAESRAKSEGVI